MRLSDLRRCSRRISFGWACDCDFDRSVLDIDAFLFSNSGLVLDSGALYGYIANHMTNRYSQQNRRNTITRVRFVAIGTVLMFALTTLAKQTSTSSGASGRNELPSVEEQLKVLTEKLDLTADQQVKIKPILQQLHDITVKLMMDKSLSREERLAKVRPWRYETDKKIRTVLNDDQKKRLDQYEQGPHPEMHGNLNGTP
jgi:hypothetical protein